MDVIVVLPNTTSETSGALNSMAPGGSNHFDKLLLLYKATTNTKYQIGCIQKHHSNVVSKLINFAFFDVINCWFVRMPFLKST